MDKENKHTELTQVEKAALLKTLLRQRGDEDREKVYQTTISPDRFPLSVGQLGLWLLYERFPHDDSYHVIAAQELSGPINSSILRTALTKLAERHQLLRSRISEQDGSPSWLVGVPDIEFHVRHVNVAEQSRISELVEEIRSAPFDLRRHQAWRAHLFFGADQYQLLVLAFHHIITDAWSIRVLQKELFEVYADLVQGRSVGLSVVEFQYSDYVLQQQQMLSSEKGVQLRGYWCNQLQGELPILNLPVDLTRGKRRRIGAAHQINIAAPLYDRINHLACECRVTPFIVLIAAYAIFLHRYSGQHEIVIGVPVALRGNRELSGLVGYLVNLVPIRVRLLGDQTFVQTLEYINQVVRDARANGDYPFQSIVKDLNLPTDYHTTQVFQTVFNLLREDGPVQAAQINADGCRLPIGADPYDVTQGEGQFDLMLELNDNGQYLSGYFKYDSNLFLAETIERIAENYLVLLASLLENAGQVTSIQPVMSAGEAFLVSNQWCGKAFVDELDLDCSIISLFEEHRKRAPDKIAVVHKEETLTYTMLGRLADRMADRLRTAGCAANSIIGLYAEPGLEMIVGMLSILKSGGAYLPLNPSHPEKRIYHIIELAKPVIVLSSSTHPGPFDSDSIKQMAIDVGVDSDEERQAPVDLPAISADQLAYIMYTSGSTGTPKGVMIEHRNVVAMLSGFNELAPPETAPRGMLITPFNFDVSVWEIFTILCFGGTLYIPPDDAHFDYQVFFDEILTYGLTTIWVPPGLVTSLVKHITSQSNRLPLKRLFVGVEPISQTTLQLLKDYQKDITVVNGYGPTETTVFASLFEFKCRSGESDRTPIGSPVKGYRIDIVDSKNRPVPIGVAGEILISGAGVGRGYLDPPDTAEQVFTNHPWIPALRCYRSGDLGRWLTDGNIEYVGRIDNQAKILGTRIELDEVNAILSRQESVVDSVVLVDKSKTKSGQLVAFIVLLENTSTEQTVLLADIGKICQSELPRYMLPARYIAVQRIFRNENGKVDVDALMSLIIDQPVERIVDPQNRTEEELLSIWQTFFPNKKIGVTVDFFEMGGDSLLALQLLAKIKTTFSTEISTDQLFSNTTIRDIAGLLMASTESHKTFKPIQRADRAAYIRE